MTKDAAQLILCMVVTRESVQPLPSEAVHRMLSTLTSEYHRG